MNVPDVSPPSPAVAVVVAVIALVGAGSSMALVLAGLAASRDARTLAGGIWGDVVGLLTFPLGIALAAGIGAGVACLVMPSLSRHRLRVWVLVAPLACAVAPWMVLAATPLARTLGSLPWIIGVAWCAAWVALTPLIVHAEARPKAHGP